MLSAVATLPDDEAIEHMTADVVNDLLKHDVDTNDLDLSDVKDYQTTHSMIKPTIDWHHYIKKHIARGRPLMFCTFTTEDCDMVARM